MADYEKMTASLRSTDRHSWESHSPSKSFSYFDQGNLQLTIEQLLAADLLLYGKIWADMP